MTRTCFFFFRNPLNVSSVRWCTSLATSLHSFSGRGGGGGSFGLSIQTQTNKKLTQRFQYVNIRKMLGRLFTVSYFSKKGRNQASTLAGRQFVLKSTEARWGRVSNLPSGVVGGGPHRYKSLGPPSQNIWNQDGHRNAKRSISAILRKNKGLWTVKLYQQNPRGSEWWQSQSRCPLGYQRKEKGDSHGIKVNVEHEKWGVFYPTEK